MLARDDPSRPKMLGLPPLEPVENGVGKPEGTEETQLLTALDATRRAHACVCRLCAKTRRSRCSADAAARRRTAARSPGSRSSIDSSAPGAAACRWTSPTGFSGVPPPGPATPVTDTPTSAPSASRTPCAMAAGRLGGNRPVTAQDLVGDSEQLPLDAVFVGDDPAGEDFARAGNGREPCGDEPTRAALGCGDRQPLLAGQVEHELLDGPLVLGEQGLRKRLGQRLLDRVGVALRAGLDDEVDLHLQVMRADRDVDPLTLSPGPLDHPCDGRLG